MKMKKMKLSQRERLLVRRLRDLEAEACYDGQRDYGMLGLVFVAGRIHQGRESFGIRTRPSAGLMVENGIPDVVRGAMLETLATNMVNGAEVFRTEGKELSGKTEEQSKMAFPADTPDDEILAQGEAMMARLDGKPTH